MEKTQKNIEFMKKWAWFLDKSFRVPGTSYRMGVESLIGLIPGFGDWLGGMISSYILWHAVQSNVPSVVLGRMAVNVAADSFLGMIPIVGDIFDIGFKSNTYNLRLLEQYYQGPEQTVKKNSIFLAIFIIVMIGLILLSLWMAFKVMVWVWSIL